MCIINMLLYKMGKRKIKKNKFFYSSTFSLQSNQCYCGNSYGLYGKSARYTGVPCPGNPNEYCGGVGLNYVYSLSPCQGIESLDFF